MPLHRFAFAVGTLILGACAPASRSPAVASGAPTVSCPLPPSASLLTASRAYRGQAGSVYGLVLDSVTLHPVTNVTVRFDDDTARQLITDTLGRFERTGLTPGSHKIEVQFIGYRRLRDSINVLPSDAVYAAVRLSPSMLDGPCSGFEIIVSDSSKDR